MTGRVEKKHVFHQLIKIDVWKMGVSHNPTLSEFGSTYVQKSTQNYNWSYLR